MGTPNTWKWVRRVVAVVLGVIGLGGVTDDLDQWASWLSVFNQTILAWVLLGGAILLIVGNELDAYRRRRTDSKPPPFTDRMMTLIEQQAQTIDQLAARLGTSPARIDEEISTLQAQGKVRVSAGGLVRAIGVSEEKDEAQPITPVQRRTLLVDCGNLPGLFNHQWHGAGAEEHPTILLLRIRNPYPVQAKGCRVRATYDAWDARFGSQPRDLPWFDTYEKYEAKDRPMTHDLGPDDEGSVVLADQGEEAFRSMVVQFTEENGDVREYSDVKVTAWADEYAPIERSFRLMWTDERNPYEIRPIDEGAPCVDELPPEPSIFFPDSDEDGR